jgi:2-iminobutanoate/2-iminopropanoate deaminase
MKKQVTTERAAKPGGPYSQAIVAGDYVFVAGQGPITPDGRVVRGTIAEQTRLTLENIREILKAAGSGLEDVVRVSVHLSELNEENFRQFNEVYKEYFRDPLPARITVGSQLLGIDVEIEAIAYKGRSS